MTSGVKTSEFWLVAAWAGFIIGTGAYILVWDIQIELERLLAIWGAPGLPAGWWMQQRTSLKKLVGGEGRVE